MGPIRENGVMRNLGNPNIFFHYWDSPLNETTGSGEQRAGVQGRNIRVGHDKQIDTSIPYHWLYFKESR